VNKSIFRHIHNQFNRVVLIKELNLNLFNGGITFIIFGSIRVYFGDDYLSLGLIFIGFLSLTSHYSSMIRSIILYKYLYKLSLKKEKYISDFTPKQKKTFLKPIKAVWPINQINRDTYHSKLNISKLSRTINLYDCSRVGKSLTNNHVNHSYMDIINDTGKKWDEISGEPIPFDRLYQILYFHETYEVVTVLKINKQRLNSLKINWKQNVIMTLNSFFLLNENIVVVKEAAKKELKSVKGEVFEGDYLTFLYESEFRLLFKKIE